MSKFYESFEVSIHLQNYRLIVHTNPIPPPKKNKPKTKHENKNKKILLKERCPLKLHDHNIL